MSESRTRWMILITVIVGTFLGRLDQTVVNLAIPKIIDGFGITVSAASWIATAYIIANAVFVPVWGKLGDTIGRKKIYVMGFTIFIVGSVLAALAWNLGSLLLFRVIQAIAASADYPTAMAILAVTFREPRERAQALGIWSSAFASSAVFGPLIGGPLIDIFGWRSVFMINLPVGLIGLYMAITYIKESVSEKKTFKFDWWGSAFLGAALASLVLVLDQGVDWGWTDPRSLIAYGVTIVCSVIFYYIEKNHDEPVVDFSFFKNRTFNATILNNLIVFLGMMGSVFAIPIFAQTFLGYNATKAGMLFIPMGLAIPFSAALLGRFLLAKVSARTVVFWSTAGAAMSFYFLSWIDARSSAWDIMWPLMLMALFMGAGMAQRTALIASSVPQSEIGVASSILALVRNFGGAFGIAIFATLTNILTKNNVLNIARNSILHITDKTQYQTAVILIELKAEILAYSQVYIIAAAVVLVGAFAIFIMKKGDAEKAEMSHEDAAMAEA